MKIVYSLRNIIILYMIILLSCKEQKPVEYINNNSHDDNPVVPQIIQSLSPDRDKLAFIIGDGTLEVLNLKSGIKMVIDISNKLPKNMIYIGCSNAIWCPYNSNRLLLTVGTSMDTIGNQKSYLWGMNLFIVSIDGSELTKITPSMYPKQGSSGIDFIRWLNESNENRDLISGFFRSSSTYINDTNNIKAIYIPQVDKFINNPYKALISQAKDGKYFCFDSYYSPSGVPNIMYINSIAVKFKNKINQIFSSDWSPNSKILALSVMVPDTSSNANQSTDEIWLMDVEKFLIEKPVIIPVKILKTNKQINKYGGLFATFLTDSTLAVTLHNSGDKYAFIYEITIDGDMVRQLTFEP